MLATLRRGCMPGGSPIRRRSRRSDHVIAGRQQASRIVAALGIMDELPFRAECRFQSPTDRASAPTGYWTPPASRIRSCNARFCATRRATLAASSVAGMRTRLNAKAMPSSGSRTSGVRNAHGEQRVVGDPSERTDVGHGQSVEDFGGNLLCVRPTQEGEEPGLRIGPLAVGPQQTLELCEGMRVVAPGEVGDHRGIAQIRHAGKQHAAIGSRVAVVESCAVELIAPAAGCIGKDRPLQLIEALIRQRAALIRRERREVSVIKLIPPHPGWRRISRKVARTMMPH